ncbi:hypothetical protein FOMG_17186 [Fusarium oxysporum f. sp. melonis 26406]|uniref:Amine oxidase n=1 Tax=Fusarium oxysporum f. sp. melonis 26406 TaxID=1089452 RepID=W9ZYQ9_FUSOX|nr:hypothetical protein FOMG_17186 [Fusarium oxysporum f. sp. melonis 26406]
MKTTTEGQQWTEASGLQSGLPSRAVVSPSQHQLSSTQVYDAIIVGAGYAGLIAARDLVLQKIRVLLLEARDRIGGRTWTSDIAGYPFEMGGTWVHWQQPHVFSELSRYRMEAQLDESQDYTDGVNYVTIARETGHINISKDDAELALRRAFSVFCDVDGDMGKSVMRLPHTPLLNRTATSKWDDLSAQDRLLQIQDQLSEDELVYLKAWILSIGGASLEGLGFLEILKWWALCNHNSTTITEYCAKWKLKNGQTSFASAIFAESVATGYLSFRFSCPVAKIQDSGIVVRALSRDGQTYSGRSMISTLPLNVLNDVQFEPPLSNLKIRAAEIGHVNKAVKVHYEVTERNLRSWDGIAYPGTGLVGAYADGVTPAGNVHIVAFGAESTKLVPGNNIKKTKTAITDMHPMTVKRMVFHDWTKDEFAKGAWCAYEAKFTHRFHAALQEPQGLIRFASSDWADGWRGFIDGAIEQGQRAAKNVAQDLQLKRSANL